MISVKQQSEIDRKKKKKLMKDILDSVRAYRGSYIDDTDLEEMIRYSFNEFYKGSA
jgi:hypothetical protein